MGLPFWRAQVSMNSFWKSATTGPSICRSVSRQGTFWPWPGCSFECWLNEPPE